MPQSMDAEIKLLRRCLAVLNRDHDVRLFWNQVDRLCRFARRLHREITVETVPVGYEEFIDGAEQIIHRVKEKLVETALMA
jgi:hypothetical protein